MSFHEVIRRAIEPARPLPHHFQPLARAITGSRHIGVRTGPGTRAALAAAGKEAATVGGVIHLRRALDRSPRSAEIVAHELVHAAHPSSRPRFFADDHHGPEEALAEHTGRLARALVAPQLATPPVRRSEDRLAWGTQGMAVSAMGGALSALSNDTGSSPLARSVIARSPTAGTRPSLVERTADLFRRPVAGEPPVMGSSSWGTVQRRMDQTLAPTALPTPAPTPAPATNDATVTISGATFDALLEALEQRVIDELERRGMRHHPGVF